MIAVCQLRLWPQKRWKRIVLVTFLALIVVGAISTAYVLLSINKDVISPIVVINSGGVKTALIVYQPGLTSRAPNERLFPGACGKEPLLSRIILTSYGTDRLRTASVFKRLEQNELTRSFIRCYRLGRNIGCGLSVKAICMTCGITT
jgi:hypothetical protein